MSSTAVPVDKDECVSAIRRDDAGQLEVFLRSGRSVGERLHFNRTLLHFAAAAGALACVRLLLANGANLEAFDEGGHTPLLGAIGGGHTETAAFLLKSGAISQYIYAPEDTPKIRERVQRNVEQMTATAWALAKESGSDLGKLESIIGQLLGQDLEAMMSEQAGQIAKLWVARREVFAIHSCSNLETLRLLVEEYGSPVNCHDGACYWPLKSFAESGDAAAVGWLLKHGATPDFTSTGDTALHAAVAGDHIECARQLVEAGANPNQQDVDGCVPMYRTKSEAMLDLLLASGADPNIRDQSGFRPFHWVKDPALKKRLLALKKPKERKPRNGQRLPT